MVTPNPRQVRWNFSSQFLIGLCAADIASDCFLAKVVWTDGQGLANSPQRSLLWEMDAFVTVMFDHTTHDA